MKYRIKWLWAGAEQTAIVSNNDGAKPVAALYFYDNNGRIDKDDYVLLHEGETITGNCRAIGLTSCVVIGRDWVLNFDNLDWELTYRGEVMLRWYTNVVEPVFIHYKSIADWFVEYQPVIDPWQVKYAQLSDRAMAYLKASIEHE